MKEDVMTFDEATAEYTELTGEIPTFEKMINLYHRYRVTLHGYGWRNFKEFMEWEAE